MRVLRELLLFVALASSQGLALAHSFDHPALKVDHACVLCTHVPGLDTGPLAPPSADLELPWGLEGASFEPHLTTSFSAQRRYNSRAPPLLVGA